MFKRVILFISILISLSIFNISKAKSNKSYPNSFISHVYINKETVEKGFTFVSTDKKFFLGITPGVLSSPTKITLKNFWPQKRINTPEFGSLQVIDNRFLPKIFSGKFPFGYELVGDIYEFDIHNAPKVYDPKKPLWIKIKNDLPKDDDRFKAMYYFDKGKQQWIEIPSKYDKEKGVLKAAIHLPYAMVAMFVPSKKYGIASWYKYKNCDCAASIDYPKGSILKVTNLDNSKFAIVKVNDYGPERWTRRIIDLDKTVFKKISKLFLGLARVKVDLIKLPDDE